MRIALCGEARSGKDTVAEILNSSDNFHRIAFGDYMKDAYYKKFPERENAPKDREHMISFSQPLVELYNRIWIDWAESELTLCDESGAFNNFVITDLRQPHEEKWCRENGFHIVRVHADIRQRRARAEAKGETLGKDLPYWVEAEYHIYNSGSLEDLQSQVDNLLDCLNEIEMKRRRL
ncbi:AAA family ATPase [Bacillus thuringiensis]|uniref:deoxynucleotide monophosphate kinase family protein n=1 Tax=Bacillus thuringiensis TaxID=1428 RepID=UPI000BFB251C|nr:AAA family ATPase [Bacillus thuringiensis]PGM38509.1 hypothetical protein CN945_01195 [Bacillus thuringiensis]